MSFTNNITVLGNLVEDPTLRFTNNKGKAVSNARVAVNERINLEGQWRDRTTFVNVVVWGDQAENFAASARKGDRVFVSGRLEAGREYIDGNGEKQYRTEIVASEVGVSCKFATVQTTDVEHTVVTEVPA